MSDNNESSEITLEDVYYEMQDNFNLLNERLNHINELFKGVYEWLEDISDDVKTIKARTW